MVELSEKIEAFFSKYPLRTYKKGHLLIHAQQNPEHIFFIVSGKVRQYDISQNGDEIVVNAFKPGAFFPLLGSLTDIPNKYFYDIQEDATARVAPSKEVVAFLKENPDVLFDLLKRVYIGIDGLLGRMIHLMSGSAKSRVLYELVIECRRFGKPAQDGSVHVALNETDLASRAGLTRETVSREIQKINQHDIITVAHGGMVVKNIEALEEQLAAAL